MTHKQLIGPRSGSTSADLKRSPGHFHRLPDDLLRDASTRLRVMSMLFAVLWVLGTVAGHLAFHVMQPDNPGWTKVDAGEWIAVVSVIVSIALYAYTRRGDRDPQFVLDLGLWYMVYTALALSIVFHLGGLPAGMAITPEISWIGAVVVIFAAIIPTTEKKVLIAGLAAVSMNPISMLLLAMQGRGFGSRWLVLVMHYPDYFLVGVAVVISHVVTKLGHQVTRAREMGSYQLGELLGKGGMGEVYKATHRMLPRPAAIKLIRLEMLGGTDPAVSARAIARFRREAEAAAHLQSAHTVDLYDFGVTEDQTLYLVMEFLDGMDLESLVRQHGPMPASRVVHILRQACESLEEAHARGLVPRDIKPANIYIGRVGCREDFVKVLDFGLVKTAASDSAQSLATLDGVI